MTELEKMMRARDYIKKLADGVDPLTGDELPEDCTYNNVRLSRCMFYVAEVLGEVIANGGEVGSRVRRQKVQYIPRQEDITILKPHTESMAITKFIDFLQEQLGAERGKISREPIITWLVKNNLLREVQSEKGIRRYASENGMAIGIQNVDMLGKQGNYTAVYYNTKAQQIIIEALMDIFSGQK